MTITRLGYPGQWYPCFRQHTEERTYPPVHGHLYDDGGLPVHLYPFYVTADGEGPCDASDPNYDHDVCWCGAEGCIGIEDDLGFPADRQCERCRKVLPVTRFPRHMKGRRSPRPFCVSCTLYVEWATS